MKTGATYWERFEGWFIEPINKLKECPEGDGGFLAMSAALFLCERYYRTITNTHEYTKDNLAFKKTAANDLGVDENEFKIFWIIYRHGIQHQGMPKKYIDKGVTYGWRMDDSFNGIPEFEKIEDEKFVIKINPWKFADIIKNKYKNNPEILEKATVHTFGEVFSNNK